MILRVILDGDRRLTVTYTCRMAPHRFATAIDQDDVS